ncbi:hypothetical protein [Streptomyces zhihengii]|uniref:hypothetical protein n=1 Tax=Streptomyces zhihengii TaxID=1818004 RepID=UPI0033B05198
MQEALRAAQALDSQLHYQLQHPLPAHRHATTGSETDLTRVRDALKHTIPAGPSAEGPADSPPMRRTRPLDAV